MLPENQNIVELLEDHLDFSKKIESLILIMRNIEKNNYKAPDTQGNITQEELLEKFSIYSIKIEKILNILKKIENDNYVMKFLKYNIPEVYRALKKDWIGKRAKLKKDNIYFTCSMNELAQLFKTNGGNTGIDYIKNNIYIDFKLMGKYEPIKIRSFRTAYSKLG